MASEHAEVAQLTQDADSTTETMPVELLPKPIARTLPSEWVAQVYTYPDGRRETFFVPPGETILVPGVCGLPPSVIAEQRAYHQEAPSYFAQLRHIVARVLTGTE